MTTKLCPTCSTPIPAAAPGGFCPGCLLRDAAEPASTGQPAPSLEAVAEAFPTLEIISLIGQGGMGSVYKVRQPSLDRIVALKLLAPQLSRDPAFAERFTREARVLGKLNHPNIVTVYEHGESGGFYYLIMEYVDGVNLRQAMRAGRFTPEQALSIVPGICDALQAAHAQGIWHRDIKPENILLDQRGGVKIADFGIAKLVEDQTKNFTLTGTGNALGSIAYMAPEQHESPHTVDHRADIYSLGVVIYEMLTGELPLGRFPAPSQRAAVSTRIDEIVFQTLEKERELRQQSATEVKTDVQSVGDLSGHASVNRKSPAPQRPKLERPARLTVISILLVVVCGILLFPAAFAMSQGDARDITVALLAVAVLMGYVAAWVALSYMKSDHISKGWRGGVQVIAWTPIFALVGAAIVAGMIYGFAIKAERDRKLSLIRSDAGRSEFEMRTFPVAITEAKQSGLISGDESWTYSPRHMTSGEIATFIKTPAGKSSKALDKTRNFGWQDGMTTQFSEGKFTLTGPGDQVRPLMTWLRMMDIAKVPPAGYKDGLPPETLAMAALAALMVHNEYDDKMFSSSLSKTLQAEHITAPQLARSLRNHVWEFEKITVAGAPKENAGKSDALGATTTYEITIPCSDRMNDPLKLSFIEINLGFKKEEKFISLSPWLLEEAKLQSAEPFVKKPGDLKGSAQLDRLPDSGETSGKWSASVVMLDAGNAKDDFMIAVIGRENDVAIWAEKLQASNKGRDFAEIEGKTYDLKVGRVFVVSQTRVKQTSAPFPKELDDKFIADTIRMNFQTAK